MANVKVAIRVRPLNPREIVDGGRIAVQVEDKVVRVRNVKLDGRTDGRAEAPGDSRERLVEFAFDYCYWSVNPEASNYASQEEPFRGGFGGVFWIIVLLQNPSSLQFEVTYLPIYQSGKGYKAISKALGLPRTTVRAIIYKWRKHGTVENLPRSGRPTKITPRAQRQLIQEVTKVPTTTSKELQASLTSVKVFQDLGMCVLAGAAEGYNVCLFAYGQTGSGKTYTMMGNPDSLGLTPRICQGLFRSGVDSPDGQTCRVEVSFLEIYNERVRDLLRGADQKKPVALRVREHPEKGPYVQGLTQHVVEDYKQAADLLEAGIANRITAATHVHDASSRSHAIFSIQYTQAILENNLPSEVVSKINLVDLAGSERADPNYCRDRITEGANINKSLVTLGIVISALAQNSQMCSSSQSINSMLSEGEVSMVGSQSSSLSSSSRRHCFIPYRDSVLTWLLKDSLGGNSKTIMIATISPSCSGYSETLSTLRYAAHAKNIVNKPRVNEDASVRLIRELREEIDRLKSMLLSFSLQRNPSPSLSDERDSSLSDIVLQNELKVEQLTKDWSESWRDKRALLEQYSVDINQDKSGVQIHSLRPHLMSLEPDILSTGVTIYHLQEGITRIGPQGPNEEEPHIVMPEGSVCEIENQNGVVILKPRAHTACMVNNREVTEPCRLAQGAVITLAGRHKFRFNHPAEAAALRERRRIIEGGSLFSSSELNALMPNSRPDEVGSQEASDRLAPWQRLEEHQRYVECLREEILVEQRRAEKDLEREQAHLHKQHSEIQQWILQEKQRLAAIREKGTLDSGVQTDIIPLPALAGINENESSRETVRPSLVVDDRKRVVQEELLKHHALRRNENRIRRKRLRYQLERIARKRHLLEAKQELQRLETALSLGVDSPQSPDLGSPSKRRERPLVLRRHSFSVDLLSRLYPQHTPIFRSGGKSSPHEGNKGLESIRKALSRSVGFGIKMALSRVFRKPPLGSRGGKSAKSVSRVKTQFAVEGKKDKNVGDMVTKQSHSPIKSAVSCNGLDQLISLKEKKQGRWHSAEALTKKTRRWVKMQQDLTNWVENNGNEAPDDSSDCDSLFSVDSLSSAYAIALAEQLQQEDCEPSEAESEDSQMSKDSLVKEHSGTTDPKAALNLSHSICHTFLSSPNPQSTTGRERIESKEMPEEFFRSQKSKRGYSSTLSSAEDSKEHISTESKPRETFHTPVVCNKKILTASGSVSCNDTLDLASSSGQVDEIVLVYSSEHESQDSKQDLRKCDHGTQTVMFHEDLEKKCRHKRSSTQVTVSRQAQGTSTTWTSLQNMSEHLSELIVSTSDLLGNIQCMRTGESSVKKGSPLKPCSKVSKIRSDRYGKSDGSTQTTTDVGIQTEDSALQMKQNKVLQSTSPVQNPKPHEVNVIVKVISSEVCSVPKQECVIKSIRDQDKSRETFETIKSMPDLRPGGPPPSEQFGGKLDTVKILSLETVTPNQHRYNPVTVDHKASNTSNRKCTSQMLAQDNQTHQQMKPKNYPDKRVLLIDRASSPILTVDVTRLQQKKIKSGTIHTPTDMLSKTTRNPPENKPVSTNKPTTQYQRDYFYTYQTENKSVMSLENLSNRSCVNADEYSTDESCSKYLQNRRKKPSHGVQSKVTSQSILCSPLSHSHSSSVKHRQPVDMSQNALPSSTPINHSHRSSMQEYKRRVYKEMSCWSDLSKDTFQYQEEDSVSLAQSDCNTDALVSINPLAETSPPQEDYQIPENLPMHNKFTNWSGISQQPPARLANQNNSAVEKSPDINTHNLQLHSAESESLGCRYKPDLLESADRRAREIERLRMEREQVLASMQLDLSPHPLSVELTEAKLHYGLGKTDTLLKMLKSSSKTESTISTKQQLYDRHRRSIDGLRKEREDRLQMSRRARSLSPSKHPNSTTNITEQSQRAVALPSRHREYLQQLRKEVVEMSRVPDPPRREGQYPTDIELLLRDYSRAREEAKTEIARARVRLRERTEQEKRRLEQQALSQSVKDHLRLCTRVSSSTLCTGSNLSLSSGPTSGYNSSNAALLKDGTSPSIQVTGVSDRELRVRSRPPMIPLQSLQAPRSWLSAQDIRLESSSSGYELHSSSSPSTPSGRQRTCSFSSPSSISIPYQDIADCTLTSAISEFHLASGGDVRNLLAGNAEAGWRHQGLENGVQTFYRPSSRPSSYGFLGVMELERPLASLWSLIRDHSKTHLYNKSLKSMWARLLDDTTQLVYLLTDPSNCHMKQPRDFCCLSAESKQDDMWVLAMQSVFEESLPRPSVDTVRGEMFPSAWILQRSQRQGREVVTVIYLLQVDLGTPTLPQRLVNEVARKQAAVIADLDSFLSL
ncbi:hypothetical protein QTP70_019230 [Hemibagrus guttatus]|uniref:StAR-related lipid transfer protein 9 n=1 Tax=Hemibagrus guttatus TaxID=175788 RepID=A0AAE0R0B8_9TELE|nr:hypothetical protein QTP70_019230 [Hemibagrus guttatus]